MFDFRYHALSLVAVFMALVIGILLGIAIGDKGLISSARTDIEKSLRSDLRNCGTCGGTCNIAYLDDDGRTLHDPYGRCSDPELKTDKVTMSATAKDRAAGDPNITYRVSGNSKDVSEVLNSFK